VASDITSWRSAAKIATSPRPVLHVSTVAARAEPHKSSPHSINDVGDATKSVPNLSIGIEASDDMRVLRQKATLHRDSGTVPRFNFKITH
jgi:hypothetical protein